MVMIASGAGCGASGAPRGATTAAEVGAGPRAVAAGTPTFVLQRGHSGAVSVASFSPDGRAVVTASYDSTAKLWDAATGALRATLEGHSEPVATAGFSPDGRAVVTASYDSTAKLWDAATGALRATLAGHSGPVLTASFSPDGHTVLTAGRDGKAKLWDTATGDLRATLTGHSGPINDASFSPDGRTVVTGGVDGTAKLWDAATGDLRATLDGRSDMIMSASFSPDGRTLVTASYERTAQLWDATTGALRATLEGHSDVVRSATFSPDGRTVVTASDDRSAKLWDVATGTLHGTLAGHLGPVEDASFSPDGRTVVTASNDVTTAKLWDVGTCALRATLEGHTDRVVAMSFSPDGRTVVTASRDGTARLWDTATGSLRGTFAGRSTWVRSTTLSPDARIVVTGSWDGTAKVWDAATGALRATLETHGGPVEAASIGPDGRTLVTASYERIAQLWDATTGELRATLEGHTDVVQSASFSSDGSTVVTASWDRTAKLWDTATGALRATLVGHSTPVLSASFSPDGRTVVTATQDGSGKLWDAATGELRTTLEGHSGYVKWVSFSPDGRTVATGGGWDGTAGLWDVATGALRTTLSGHSGPVAAATFSPDGRTVLTCSEDRTAKLWDAATGAQRATLVGHSGAIWAARFSSDGSTVVTMSHDGTAKLWDAATGTLRGTFQGHDGTIREGRWNPASCIMSLVGQTGRIEHIRCSADYRITGQYAIDAFDRPDGTYATLYSTPDGLFTGDEDAFSRVIYRLGPDILHDDLVTADQLFERFHRSTLVEDFWAGRPLALPGDLETGVGRPPSVELIDVPSRQQGASQQELTLRVRATDRGGGVGELRVFVNGARADVLETVTRAGDAAGTRDSTQQTDPGARGLRLRTRAPTTEERTSEVRSRSGLYGPGEHEVRVLLAPGDNVITVEGYSVLGEVRGERAQATVRLEGVPEVAPRLFVVAVSAGDYADDTLNLRYANADATAMVRALERQAGSGKLFAESIVVRLSDADATRAKVLEALARVKRDARPEDAVVFYVASHGMVHRCGVTNEARYQLLLAGTRRADVCADALDTAQLTRAMAGIPAQEKLLLLDTCQSGGAVDEGSLSALRGELRDEGLRAARAAGVAVISGSAASQSSYEVAELGQGLFTFALLRGLEGRAALGGIERGGRIGVANLVRYVSRQLPILAERYANARQTPTYGAMGNDFTVAIARPDDPPLLAMTSLPPAVRDAERTANRGLDAPDDAGVNAQLDRHVRAHANELEACTHGRVTEVVARWGVDGQVRFALSGAGAGTNDEACARRALGTLRVEDAEHRAGEMRLVAAP